MYGIHARTKQVFSADLPRLYHVTRIVRSVGCREMKHGTDKLWLQQKGVEEWVSGARQAEISCTRLAWTLSI